MTVLTAPRSASPAPPAGNTGRASWHRRANAVVLGWFIVSGTLLALSALPGNVLPAPRWLALHALFIGGATTAIVVWSGHFAAALTRVTIASRRAETARLVILQAGAALVLIGTPHGWNAVLDAGAALLAGCIVWHIIGLTRMVRRAVAPRFRVVVFWYVAAAGFMLAGGLVGVLLGEGAGGSIPFPRLLAAHVVLMVLGWVGMTVQATLITLWPTVLRTRMDERSDTAGKWALAFTAIGVTITATGFLLAAQPCTIAGLTAVMLGVVIVFPPLFTAGRRRHPSTGAAWSLATALGWFVVVLARLLIASWAGDAESAMGAFDQIAPLVAVGFVGQAVLAALSGLLPTMLGGGPLAVRSSIARLEFRWQARFFALNAGLVLAVIPLPSPVRAAGWWLVLLGAGLPFVVLSFSLLISRRARVSVAPPLSPPAAGGAARSKPVWQRRAMLAGLSIGVVVLLFAVLIATSGRGGQSASTPVASSTTAGTRTVAVSLEMLRISPHSLTVPAGTHLRLEVTNRDGMRHDLAVPGGKRTPMLSKGQHALLDVGVVTRSMTLRCTVPGHAAAGMTMNVKVDAPVPPKAAAPAGDSAAKAFDPMAQPASSDPYRDPHLAPLTGGASIASRSTCKTRCSPSHPVCAS